MWLRTAQQQLAIIFGILFSFFWNANSAHHHSAVGTCMLRRVSVMTCVTVSHWHILIMLWMFLQLYEDNKACFAHKSTSHCWETAGARGLTCYENIQNSWNGGRGGLGLRDRRLHWIPLTLAWILFLWQEVPYENKIASASSDDWKGLGIPHQVSFFFQIFFF